MDLYISSSQLLSLTSELDDSFSFSIPGLNGTFHRLFPTLQTRELCFSEDLLLTLG